VQAYARELLLADYAPHVHRVTAPVLLLWGACDMLFPPAARAYTVQVGLASCPHPLPSGCRKDERSLNSAFLDGGVAAPHPRYRLPYESPTTHAIRPCWLIFAAWGAGVASWRGDQGVRAGLALRARGAAAPGRRGGRHRGVLRRR
jgi:hypothetical protein